MSESSLAPTTDDSGEEASRTKGVRRILPYIEGVAVAYLVLFLTIYGGSKLHLSQFFTRLSWMDAKVSELDGFTLTWLFYGWSPVYQFFAGFVEISCAVLLFFRRTRRLGALLTAPFMLNLVLLNLEYDIGAVNDAVPMLVASTVLCLIYTRDYKKFFWDMQPARPMVGRRALLAGTVAKYVIATMGVVGSAVLYFAFFRGGHAKSDLYGRWRVESVERSGPGGGAPTVASGDVLYFDVRDDFGLRTKDSVHYGTYALDPRKRQLNVAIYAANFEAYKELNYGSVRDKYFAPQNLRDSLSGTYRLDENGMLVIEARSRQDSLTIRLRSDNWVRPAPKHGGRR
jgi:hypothetical protein